MKTVIKWSRQNYGTISRVEMDSEDATTQAIAQAVIDMVSARMSMHEGDIIVVLEVE